MNKTIQVDTDIQTIQRTCLSLVGERGGLITSQSPNGITALFTKKPSLIITLILFLFGFLPGLIYYWFSGRNYQLVVQYHEQPQGGTQLSVTANGGRARKVADAIMKALGVGRTPTSAAPPISSPPYGSYAPQVGLAPPPPPPASATVQMAAPVPQHQSFAASAPFSAQPPSPNHSRFCTSCGGHLSDDVRFCTSCGAPVTQVEITPHVVVETAPPMPVSPWLEPDLARESTGAAAPPLPGYSLDTAALLPTPPVAATASSTSAADSDSPDDGLTVAVEDDSRPAELVVGYRDAAATVIDEPDCDPTPVPLLSAELVSDSTDPIVLLIYSDDQTIRIGRDSAQADFAVVDPRASRVHLSISAHGGNGVLTDMESSNGTFLNGERISAPTWLSDGDRIALGRTELTYRIRT